MITTTEPKAHTANLRYYRDHAEEYVQSTLKLDLSELHATFLQHLASGANILDAGCGSGRDSAEFLARGYRVLAIDASPEMVYAAQRLGVSATVMTFQEVQFEGEFDGIWACASLLHIARAEIGDVLTRFNRALRPGGIFFSTLKEGCGERFSEDGRFFAYYNLEEFADLILCTGSWSNLDARQTREGQSRVWLNFIARKPITSASPQTCRYRNDSNGFGTFGM
jgi:2-polyprenyl-3-methyl-5-hydroxy-6-metoxy-1,4-benzoquinol methylase